MGREYQLSTAGRSAPKRLKNPRDTTWRNGPSARENIIKFFWQRNFSLAHPQRDRYAVDPNMELAKRSP
jgi:hypothetical protein